MSDLQGDWARRPLVEGDSARLPLVAQGQLHGPPAGRTARLLVWLPDGGQPRIAVMVTRRPAAPERRQDVRRVVNREFSTLDDLLTEYVHNLSRGGVFIRSDDPLPVGTRVTLRFTVIQDELELIEGVGEVVRVDLPGGPGPAGMGVAFVELTDESRQRIEKILVRR